MYLLLATFQQTNQPLPNLLLLNHPLLKLLPHKVAQDVLEFASSRSQQPVSQAPSATPQFQQATSTTTTTDDQASEWTDIELSQMRKVIAERLLFSKQSIPHFYIQADIEMDNIVRYNQK